MVCKCKHFLIQTQMVSMDSSQCPLSEGVAPLRLNTIHEFIRGTRSDLQELHFPTSGQTLPDSGNNPQNEGL